MRAEARTLPRNFSDSGVAQIRDDVMQMNRDHDAFDLAMELACSLSPWGQGSPLDLLRQDLGLKTQAQVRSLLDVLRERGYRFVTGHLPGSEGMAVGVADVSVEPLREACRGYWREVYGAGWRAVEGQLGRAERRRVA